MKPSAMMLKGFEMAGGKGCVGRFCRGDYRNPDAVCALGAMNLGATGDALGTFDEEDAAEEAFSKAYGCSIQFANDNGLPVDVIAGMLAAEGY